MELPKIDLKYLREAFKEPINFWGMAGFAVAAAYVQDVTPLVAALATETLYLATVPASTVYRRLVDRREKQRLLKLREQQRESQIKLFDPREREAVEYLRWMKNQIYSNYKKFTGTKQIPHNIQSLDQRWEDFVDLLDVYRRRKHHLRSINRQAVQNQLVQAERSVEAAKDDREKRIQRANVEILKRRVAAFNDIERSVKLVEGQLQSIENFFGACLLARFRATERLDRDDQADARRDLRHLCRARQPQPRHRQLPVVIVEYGYGQIRNLRPSALICGKVHCIAPKTESTTIYC
jgi:hypothetical protein